MKIKDLIKHLETLDQEKELVLIATDPNGWDTGLVIDDSVIHLDEVFPDMDNGLEEKIEPEYDEDEYPVGIECYVIRLEC